jgi:hypothetical protein
MRGIQGAGALKSLVCGICDYDNCAIYIDADLNPQARWQVMWHELLHTMCRSHPINEDEFTIDVLAGEVFTVLRQMGFYGKEEQHG